MNRRQRTLLHIALVSAAPAAVLAAFTAILGGLWWATLDEPQRTDFVTLLVERAALLFFVLLVAGVALGALARRLFIHWVVQPSRQAERAAALLGDSEQALDPGNAPAAGALSEVINQLVQQRSSLRATIDDKVREASRGVMQEKARLAALMAELQQSVVVCNLDGRILLYNRRARLQFRALSETKNSAAGVELMGIGRSIHAVLDRQLIGHALEGLVQRLQRGVQHPSAPFVTHTRAGQLLRVNLAAVREVAADDAAPGTGIEPVDGAGIQLAGYVLTIENITREFADAAERDSALFTFTEAARASMGSLQAAVELLDEPELDTSMRERLQAVVREETVALTARIQQLAERSATTSRTRWPLEDMQGADLLAAAQRRLQALLRVTVVVGDVDSSLWLRVDSFSLLRALGHLATQVQAAAAATSLRLRLQPEAGSVDRVCLDLSWQGAALDADSTRAWEHEPLRVGEDAGAITLRDVVERHAGAFWLAREAAPDAAWSQTFFRWLLPREGGSIEPGAAAPGEATAEALGELGVNADSRPEFYDFDLFRLSSTGAQTAGLEDMPLAELSFTVFDTETTGLNPGEGDEILQIGATRIVAGKLRRQECFETLVDPQRSIPEAGIAIHGIRPEMVQGQPLVGAALAALHAFAEDTVLVAHNAAFDMRFLQLKEASTGVRFRQPVLDTLLLSAVAQPQQESHSLEAIAARLGVSVLGRHTALGDAMVTAEVFLRLLPLLQQRGVHTLKQALEAARQTYYARLDY